MRNGDGMEPFEVKDFIHRYIEDNLYGKLRYTFVASGTINMYEMMGGQGITTLTGVDDHRIVVLVTLDMNGGYLPHRELMELRRKLRDHLGCRSLVSDDDEWEIEV